MAVGAVWIELSIPGCSSLKEKRSRIRPLLARLHREFNISAAEIERLDAWGEAVIAGAVVSNDPAQAQRVLQNVVRWIETEWLDVEVITDAIEVW